MNRSARKPFGWTDFGVNDHRVRAGIRFIDPIRITRALTIEGGLAQARQARRKADLPES